MFRIRFSSAQNARSWEKMKKVFAECFSQYIYLKSLSFFLKSFTVYVNLNELKEPENA